VFCVILTINSNYFSEWFNRLVFVIEMQCTLSKIYTQFIHTVPAPKDLFILLQFILAMLFTPSGPIYVRLISKLFKSVHVDWKLLDWVTQKAPFDDHAFFKTSKSVRYVVSNLKLLNSTEHCTGIWFLFTEHAKFQGESEGREVLGMTHHNISTVDSKALWRQASELLYVLSCNKQF
jgi:hypothetical protein